MSRISSRTLLRIAIALAGAASIIACALGAVWLVPIWFGLAVLLITFRRTRDLDPDEHARLKRLVLTSYLVFTVAIIARYYAITLLDPTPGYFDRLSPDGREYDTNGNIIATAWREGVSINPVQIAGGIGNVLSVYVGVIYYVLGRSPLAAIMPNAMFACLSVYYVYRATKLIFDRETAFRAAFLAGAFPNLWLWAGMLLKDPLVTFLTCFGLYKFLSAMRGSGIGAIVQCAVAVRLLFNLRIVMALAVTIAMAVQVLFDRESGAYKYRIAVLAALVVAFGVGTTVVGYGPFGVRLIQDAPLQFFMGAYGNAGEGVRAKGLIEAAEKLSSVSALRLIAFGATRFLLAPSAWYVPGLQRASEGVMVSTRLATDYWTWEHLFYPGMWIWYFLIPPTLYGFYRAVRYNFRSSIGIVLIVGLMTLIYAIVFLGSYRQRDSLLPLIFIFTAYGMNFRSQYSVHYILLAAIFSVMIGVHLGAPDVGVAIGGCAGLAWLVVAARQVQDRLRPSGALSSPAGT